MLQVPRPSSREFRFPIAAIGFGQARNWAIRIGVPVPEAAIDEDDHSVPREN